jgi:hypothetical protein
VKISVGPVKAESRVVRRDLNPDWNQVFAIGRDKIQGGALELSVWDAVISYHSKTSCESILQVTNFWY